MESCSCQCRKMKAFEFIIEIELVTQHIITTTYAMCKPNYINIKKALSYQPKVQRTFLRWEKFPFEMQSLSISKFENVCKLHKLHTWLKYKYL